MEGWFSTTSMSMRSCKTAHVLYSEGMDLYVDVNRLVMQMHRTWLSRENISVCEGDDDYGILSGRSTG
jgi:hypothetical protein